MDEQVISQEESKKLEDAAFEEAMNDADVKAPSEPKPEPVIEEEQPQEDKQEEVNERVEVIPGFTQEELTQLKEQAALVPKLQKALEKTNGTYGGKIAAFEKIINDLRKPQPEAAEGIAKRQVSASDFKNLVADFPEMAEKLAQDLSGILTHSDKPEVNLDSLKSEFQSELAKRDQIEQERSLKRLSKLHPDYQEIAKYEVTDQGLAKFNNPAFGNWLVNQPEELQNVVFNSNDPDEVSEVLSSFKESIKPVQAKEKKAYNLEKAITPKGVNASRMLSDKDRENAAFEAAMKD